MRVWMFAVFAAGALALSAWLLLRGADAPMARRPPPAPARALPTPGTAERTAPTEPGAAGRAAGVVPATAARDGALPEAQRPRGAIDHGRAWATLPASYPAKALGPGVAAVNLTGAPVAVSAMAPRGAPPATRAVRGQVTEGGAPAAGATVLVSDRVMVFAGHLHGMAVAVTDRDGRFDVAAPVGARWALALGPHSWSALTPVGDGEVALTLATAAAALEVTVREDGAPLDATLTLTLGDGVVGGVISAPDGVFRFAALPPGPARISVGASLEFASGDDAATPIELVLTAGETVRRTIELDSANATVAAVPVVDAAATLRTVEWALVPTPAPATLAELRGRAPAMPLLGGRDAGNAYQFHRVTPAGPRVACGVAKLAGATDDAPPVVRWGCAPVAVPATGVVEVEVAIDRAAE